MLSNKPAMKKFYERYWDGRESEDTDIKWNIIKQNIPLSENIHFLDFGCGTGALLSRILKVNPKLLATGADVSKQAINHIKKKIPTANFYNIKVDEKLPFNDNSFDFILAADVMEHIYDTELIFSELKRVLKPKGKILISVPYHGMIKNILASLVAFDSYFDPTQAHIRFYTKGNLFKRMKNVGLKIIKHGYYGRFYPLSHAIYVVCEKSNISG